MRNELLSKALEEAYEPKLSEYGRLDEISDNHRFSDDFENKMDELVFRQRRCKIEPAKKRHLLRTLLVAALLFCLGFCLGAAKSPTHDFVISIVSGGRQISLDSSDEFRTMGKAYTLTNVPEGYELIFSSGNSISACEIYTFGDDCIYFGQYIKSIYHDVPLDSTTKTEYYTDENGQEYMIIDDGEQLSIVWENDTCVCLLSSKFDKETALKLCKSAKQK